MNRKRTLGLAIGIVVTAIAGVVLAAWTLFGFSGGEGDVAISDALPTAANLLTVLLGSLLLLALVVAHQSSRRARARRPVRVATTV